MMTQVRRRLAFLLAISTMLWLPTWDAWASLDCSVGQEPSFSLGFAHLHEHLGSVMGSPLECEHVDPRTGDAYLQTNTGIAVYRQKANGFMFTNGHEFWWLSADGLVHWVGWHGRAGPPGVDVMPAPQDELQGESPVRSYLKVQAATIVSSVDNDGRQLVLQHAGRSILVEIPGGCSDGEPLDGRTVFVVSNGDVTEHNARLILRIAGRECVIAAGRPL